MCWCWNCGLWLSIYPSSFPPQLYTTSTDYAPSGPTEFSSICISAKSFNLTFRNSLENLKKKKYLGLFSFHANWQRTGLQFLKILSITGILSFSVNKVFSYRKMAAMLYLGSTTVQWHKTLKYYYFLCTDGLLTCVYWNYKHAVPGGQKRVLDTLEL